jgi:hypothetical protein
MAEKYSTPYTIAGASYNLYDDLIRHQEALNTSRTTIETNIQKKKLKRQFSSQLKRASERAAKKSGKYGGVFDAIRLVGKLTGPIGAAATAGISAWGEGIQAKKGMKELLKSIAYDRFSRTYLEPQVTGAKDLAKEAQVKDLDIAKSVASESLEAYAQSEAFDTGEFMQSLKDIGDAASEFGLSKTKGIIKEKFKHHFKPSEVKKRTDASALGDFYSGAEDWLTSMSLFEDWDWKKVGKLK